MTATITSRPVGRAPVRVGIAVGITVLAWASAFVAIRRVGADIGAGPLALGRLVIASVALGGLLLARRAWVAPTGREWALVSGCGLSWFATYNVALNSAERHLDAGATAMLVNVGPILLALLAGVVLGEGFPRWLVVGALVAFGGVVLIGVATVDGRGADLAGVLLCLLAAIGYALGVLAQKPALRRLPALQVTWLASVFGAIACLPFAPGLFDALDTAPAGALAGMAYLGVVSSAIAFSTWAYALARTDASRLGVTVYLVPPLTVLGGLLVLDETPAALALPGGAICLLGVALTRRRSR